MVKQTTTIYISHERLQFKANDIISKYQWGMFDLIKRFSEIKNQTLTDLHEFNFMIILIDRHHDFFQMHLSDPYNGANLLKYIYEAYNDKFQNSNGSKNRKAITDSLRDRLQQDTLLSLVCMN